jgi:hypothetical protein
MFSTYQISKPLVSKFMSYNICNSVLVLGIRVLLIEQNGSGSVCHKTPILHSSVRLGGIGQHKHYKRR